MIRKLRQFAGEGHVTSMLTFTDSIKRFVLSGI